MSNESPKQIKGIVFGQHLLQSFLLCTIIIFFMLTGCIKVGPDYQPPETNATSNWRASLVNGLTNASVSRKNLADWWKRFNDPVLTKLIQKAIKNSPDLAMARAKLQEARAKRGLAKADKFPTLNAKGSMTRSKASEDTGNRVTTKAHDLYNAGFDASWELDIFGGKRRAEEAAQAILEAKRANLRDVLVSLCAEVALNYVEVRTYQSRLNIARKIIQVQEKTLELVTSRENSGLGTEMDVQRADSILSSTRSKIPPLRAGLTAAQNRLAVLMGQKPGTVDKSLSHTKNVPTIEAKVAVGVPAATLRRRPDIRRAERELAAQTARIGEATSDLFPKFRLLGSVGLETIEHETEFFHPDYGFWSIGPSVSWNIFDAGAIRRNIEIQSARQKQKLINYEKTVLSALEETENALTQFAREQERRMELKSAVRSAKKAEKLVRDKYKAGLVRFTAVLDAQRSLLSYRDKLAQSKGEVTSNLISVYKALGGGWQNYWEDNSPVSKPQSPDNSAS